MRLDGTKVLLSGEFEGYSREELVAELKKRGAVVATQMGMDVEVVFAGNNPTADVDAAMELGVRVEEADALRAALQGAPAPARAPAPAPVPAKAPPAKAATASRSEAPQETAARQFEKGARVRIIGGREGVGEVGEIFWWGDSKFGDGMRAGVTAESGEKYWVDEEHLGWPDEQVDEQVLEEARAANRFGKGDRVQITGGKGAGSFGTIFWWGESKWGDGMRAGVETDDGEKVWVDAGQLAAAEDDDEAGIPF